MWEVCFDDRKRERLRADQLTILNDEEVPQKGGPSIFSTRNGAYFQAAQGGGAAGDGEGGRGASFIDEAGRSHAPSAPSSQCGGAPVRRCGTPGCELAAYHEGPCQSQQVVGRTRLDPSA